MSLILAGIVDDSIVLASDGVAKDSNDSIISTNFKKFFNLGSDIYIGYAAKGISADTLEVLSGSLESHILQLKPPYLINDISDQLALISVHAFKNKDPDDFWITSLLCGYDRLSDGSCSQPQVILTNSKDYTRYNSIKSTDKDFVMAIGSADFENSDIDGSPDVKDSNELKDYFTARISQISAKNDSIGGRIQGVVITRDTAQEFSVE